MKELNERYQYGLELFLLSIDEGITGYRDDSLEVSVIHSRTYADSSVVLIKLFRLSNGIKNNMICHLRFCPMMNCMDGQWTKL